MPLKKEIASFDLPSCSISYTLIRSARKTFGLRVDGRGVRVGVPMYATNAQVQAFLASHQAWLLEKYNIHKMQKPVQPLACQDGQIFPYQGEPCVLELKQQGRASWTYEPSGRRILRLPAHGNVRAHWIRALKQRAAEWFAGRVQEYCFELNVPVVPVRLTRARTRWGSCSIQTGIRLHWRLIHLPILLSDYVVAHEVAHLRHMNHSADFWQTLEQLYPQFKEAKVALSQQGKNLPVIDLADAAILDTHFTD